MKRKRKSEASYRGVLQQIEVAARATYVDGIHRLGDGNTATPHFAAIVECFETWVYTLGQNPENATINFDHEHCYYSVLGFGSMGVERRERGMVAYNYLPNGSDNDFLALVEVLGDLVVDVSRNPAFRL